MPPPVDIVFCGSGWRAVVDAIAARLPEGAAIRMRDFARPLAVEVAEADVILPSNALLDAEVMAAARRARLIQQPAAGHDKVDLAAARARGIPVCNVPGANAAAVAETALLLMLSLARRVKPAARAFAGARIGEPIGTELAGKVLGVIGLGRSGSRLAQVAGALGMEVMAVRSTDGREALDALLARADFVSVHCPLTPATQNLLDAGAFARMKPGAFLVNCARGGVVERTALEQALASGRLGGVGLDVYWHEPWDPADPLFGRDEVVTLPHVGGSTHEAYARIAEVVAENVRRLARGEELLHRVA